MFFFGNNFRRSISLLIVFAVFAPSLAEAVTNYGPVTIVRIDAYQSPANPGALIVFSPGTPADTEGCTVSGQGYAWIDWSPSVTETAKALYAAALAAQMAGKQIGIGLLGCTADGYYPRVYSIKVF